MPSSSSPFGTLQLDSTRSQLPQVYLEYLSVDIEDVGSYGPIATHVALLKMKEERGEELRKKLRRSALLTQLITLNKGP